MKLVMVLLLAALPIYCHAGAGCQYFQDVIEKCINPEVSKAELKEFVQSYIPNEETEMAVDEFKQCFLNQSNETLANVSLMMVILIFAYGFFRTIGREQADSKFISDSTKAIGEHDFFNRFTELCGESTDFSIKK